jgi:hypothetical protein
LAENRVFQHRFALRLGQGVRISLDMKLNAHGLELPVSTSENDLAGLSG